MKKFKSISYILAFFSGIILILLIDYDQPSDLKSIKETPSINNQSKAVSSIPSNWNSIKPTSSMRDKEYKITNSKGEFNLIVFKNIGGSTEQNIS
ncbi:MAG: hypothetical protein P8M58_05460, partial [Candidatus Marinimicrobia bacterium]|nr:hypothetical protein [Candidatus Neomarinimicrobiota bacterium]